MTGEVTPGGPEPKVLSWAGAGVNSGRALAFERHFRESPPARYRFLWRARVNETDTAAQLDALLPSILGKALKEEL